MEYIESTRKHIDRSNFNKPHTAFNNYPALKNNKTIYKINSALFENFAISALDDCISYHLPIPQIIEEFIHKLAEFNQTDENKSQYLQFNICLFVYLAAQENNEILFNSKQLAECIFNLYI